jgi:hypothetical protein
MTDTSNQKADKKVKKKEKKYITEARRLWPNAVWIIGRGQYASLSKCGDGLTAVLFESQAEAERAKLWVDDFACGGQCQGRHFVVDISTGKLVPQSEVWSSTSSRPQP